MLLPNVQELITMARHGYVPDQIFGPDRPRMAARLFEARDAVATSMESIDWGSPAYERRMTTRNVLSAALSAYAEYADKATAVARS